MPTSRDLRILLTAFSWLCFVLGVLNDLNSMYKGQEVKFFIYLTNWGLILLNAFLALEVYASFCELILKHLIDDTFGILFNNHLPT